MKNLSTRAAALVLALLLAVSPAVSASEALGTELHSHTSQLAQGVTYTHQYLWSAAYSDLRTERYLEYTPNELVQPIVSYGDSVLSRTTLSKLAQALEADGKRVVGGINGDYFVLATGAPLGMVVTDGVLRSSSAYHYALGFTADGSAFIGKPELSITATFGGDTLAVSGGLNKVRTETDGFVLYTDDYNATTGHTAPGIDVILSPKTDNLGKTVEVTAEFEDTAWEPEQETTSEPDTAAGTNEQEDLITESSDLESSHLPSEEEQESTTVRQTQDTLVYTELPIIGGRLDCVVEQVLYSEGAIEIPEGKLVLSIHGSGNERLVGKLAGLQTGDSVQIDIMTADERWKSAVTAVGGLYKMVTGGVVESGLKTGQSPHTAVGIRPDGSTVFYTVDGRQSGYSVGASTTQVAERLVELGCVEAICLDGGGSTTLGASLPGEDAFGVLNRPSEGTQRAVSNALFLVARQTAPGSVSSLAVTPGDALLLSGESIDLSVRGVDAIGQLVKTYNNSAVTFTVPADAGTMQGSTFTAGTAAGSYSIQATAGGKSAYTQMTVISTPDRIALKHEDTDAPLSSITLAPGESLSLSAAAYYRNLPLLCHDELFTWSVSQGIGTVDASGIFTAAEIAGTGTLSVTAGGQTLSVPITVAGHVSAVEHFEGDFSNMADSLTARIEPERSSAYVRYGAQSARITYDATDADYAAVGLTLDLQDRGAYLSIWVCGDGSGNTLTAPMRLVDGSTQEQILSVLNFTGWQQIIAPLPDDVVDVAILKILPTGTTPSGVIRLDQIISSNQYTPDLTAPSASLFLDEDGLRATLSDNMNSTFTTEQVTVQYDGQALEFALDGPVLTAVLPELDGLSHRLTVTVTDTSGNIGRASADITEDHGRISPFGDAGEHWAKNYVNYLYDQSISNGIVNGEQLLFQPDKNITRGEFALMAARWLRLDLTQYSSVELPFADADSIPDWSLDGVKAMYALGIMQGSAGADGTYAYAGQSITRAEAMTMLGRIQHKGYPTAELTFADADSIPDWSADYVASLVAQGVIGGYADNTIAPNNPIKRGEMAKILYAMR